MLSKHILKIKNGKFYAKNCAFSMPENFYFEFPKFQNVLSFRSEDGLVHIEVSFEKSEFSAEEEFKDMLKMSGLIKLSDFKSVKRGGTAVGLFYNFEGREYGGNYEERYDFKSKEYGANQLSVLVNVYSLNGKEVKLNIFDAINRPSVKNFLNSVEYF